MLWKTKEVKLHEMNVSDTLFISTEMNVYSQSLSQRQERPELPPPECDPPTPPSPGPALLPTFLRVRLLVLPESLMHFDLFALNLKVLLAVSQITSYFLAFSLLTSSLAFSLLTSLNPREKIRRLFNLL